MQAFKASWPALARVSVIVMLAWLLASTCLLSAMLPPIAPEPANLMTLSDRLVELYQAFIPVHNEMVRLILSDLEVFDHYRMLFVSRAFRELMLPVLEPFCSIAPDGRIYMNYTKILYKFDAIVADAAKDATVAEAQKALKISPNFICLQAALGAKFGYCIRHGCGEQQVLPQFHLESKFWGEAADDEHMISVMPYAINRYQYNHDECIYVAAKRRRFDLLKQLTFEKIDSRSFYRLMSVSLPKFVIQTAAIFLQENEPDSELSEWLRLAGFGRPVALAPQDCHLPLFILRHLHENGIAVPEDMRFVDGLKDCSYSFWMYLFDSSALEAKKLVDLVLKHGDEGSKCIAGAFYKVLPPNDLRDVEKDVYQAMLTHFRFSLVHSPAIIQAYDTMMENLSQTGFSFILALADCGQFQLIDQCWVAPEKTCFWEMVIDKIYQLKYGSHYALIMANYIMHMEPNPRLLLRLIQRKVDGAYIRRAWDRICMAILPGPRDEHSCGAQLETFKSIALGLETSFDDAQAVFSRIARLYGLDDQAALAGAVFSIASYWEVSEGMLDYLLDLVPEGDTIDQKCIEPLLYLKKYSIEFWRKLIGRCGKVESHMWETLQGFRPDLIEELGLRD